MQYRRNLTTITQEGLENADIWDFRLINKNWFEQRDDFRGAGRYANEHWIASHPLGRPVRQDAAIILL